VTSCGGLKRSLQSVIIRLFCSTPFFLTKSCYSVQHYSVGLLLGCVCVCRGPRAHVLCIYICVIAGIELDSAHIDSLGSSMVTVMAIPSMVRAKKLDCCWGGGGETMRGSRLPFSSPLVCK
jgi:hypothetical protein